jgi:Zn-finger nucleic acid-binding protein
MSTALTCPRCGAPLSPGADRNATLCSYCGATAMPPPTVVERTVERVVLVAQTGDGAKDALMCPRCASALRDVRSTESVLHGCMSCGGVWLDPATVERLSRARDPDLERAAGRILGLLRPGPGLRDPLICCPVCAAPLRRAEIANSVSQIDVCDAHGTWFDRGEVVAFAEASAESRAGEVSEDDLRAAGVGGGFFSRLFSSLRGGN